MRNLKKQIPVAFSVLAFSALPAAAQVTVLQAGRLIDPEAGTAATNQIIIVEDGGCR